MSDRHKARYLCKTRGPAYRDQATAERERQAFERKKGMNPDVLQSFPCEHCGKWHLGTRITKLVGKNLPGLKARSHSPKKRLRYSVGRLMEEARTMQKCSENQMPDFGGQESGGGNGT